MSVLKGAVGSCQSRATLGGQSRLRVAYGQHRAMVYFWNWAKGLNIIEVTAVLRWQKLNHAICQNVFITSSNSMVHPSSSWGLQSVTHINRKIHAIIRLPRRFSGVQYKYFNPLLFSNHLLGAKIEVVDLYLFSNWWPIWGLVCSAVQCSAVQCSAVCCAGGPFLLSFQWQAQRNTSTQI